MYDTELRDRIDHMIDIDPIRLREALYAVMDIDTTDDGVGQFVIRKAIASALKG